MRELVYLCKEAANRVRDAYMFLVAMAANEEVDLTKDPQYQRGTEWIIKRMR